MSNMTINAAIALQKMLKERVHELRTLRSEVSAKKETTWMMSESRQKVEQVDPQFDVKIVDKKITEIEMALFKMDASVKQANAKTKIDYEADVDMLLAPLV